MNALRSHLFCCSPRIGSIYAGFYSLISSAIFLGLLFMRFVGIQLNPVESTKDQVVLSTTLAVFIVFMVSSSFLIVMAFKNRKNYFRPWLACAAVAVVVGTAMLVWHIITERRDIGKVEHWEIIIIAYHSCNVVIILSYLKRLTLIYPQNEEEASGERIDASYTTADVIPFQDISNRVSGQVPPPYAKKPPPYSTVVTDRDFDDDDDDDDDGDVSRNHQNVSLGYCSRFSPQMVFIQTISGRVPLGIPPPAYDDIFTSDYVMMTSRNSAADISQADRVQANMAQADDMTQGGMSQVDVAQPDDMTQGGMSQLDIAQADDMIEGGISQVDITPTNMSQADDMTQGDMSQVNIVQVNDMREGGMSQVDIAQANMPQAYDMTQCSMSQVDIAQVDMTQAGLTHADVRRVEATQIDTTLEANMTQTHKTGADVTCGDMTDSDMTQDDSPQDGVIQANKTYADVAQLDVALIGVTLQPITTEPDIAETDMREADMRLANIHVYQSSQLTLQRRENMNELDRRMRIIRESCPRINLVKMLLNAGVLEQSNV
ncbi:hypothetical protein LSH36_563g01085 [Paralvinella palmiformis]|uniref:DUF7027 domain-containing protein n=1 Tax=Paralvinella palmiformis TaxID=53620 RepID=A0AAD9MVR4_9ANNE|nr:hypothetical protein LSH36_563g01085 [Paralvinella palmiformis]